MYPTIDKERTGQLIRCHMELNKLTVKDVQEHLGLTCVQAVYHWINGRSLPSLDNLYALSDLFQVPMDMLIIGNRKDILPVMHKKPSNRLYIYYMKFHRLCA